MLLYAKKRPAAWAERCGNSTAGGRFYSPSMMASIRIPMMMIKINAYCFLVSFSFRKMRERIRETTHTAEMIGAAMAPLPLAMAYT